MRCTWSIRDHRPTSVLNYNGINLIIPLTSAETIMVYRNINENGIWPLQSRPYIKAHLYLLLKIKSIRNDGNIVNSVRSTIPKSLS